MTKPTRKVSLGRGLSSLLGPDNSLGQDNPNDILGAVIEIAIDSICPGKYQPRTHFDEKSLEDLAQSIQEIGVLQPIIVRKSGDHSYEIIAGERRWRAAKLADLESIPAIVKELTDSQASEAALIENIQRQDLSAMEEACAYQSLIDQFGYTQEQMSGRIGKSRSHIANMLRLLSLPEYVQALVNEKKLSAGHARALIGQDNIDELVQQILDQNLNVRDIEKRKKKSKTTPTEPVHNPQGDDIGHLEEYIQQILGVMAKIQLHGAKGNIILDFKSMEELDCLIGKFNHIKGAQS